MISFSPELVIFDCDGTLVNSEVLNNTVSADLFRKLGFPKYTPEYCFEHFAGKGWPDIRAIVEEEQNTKLPDSIYDDFTQGVSARMKNGIDPVKGAPEFVAWCAARTRVCVASNGWSENVRQSLSICGYDRFFEGGQIFTRSMVARGKPAPDLFLYAAEQMQAKPEECLVVEDSLPGVQAGLAAKMRVFGFTGSAHCPDKLEESMRESGVMQVYADFIHMKADLAL